MQAKQKAAAKAKEEADKAKKAVSRSQIGFEVKGWDETTDFEKLVHLIFGIEMDGLKWGEGYQIEPIAFGVNQLKVTCIVEDEKINVEDLTDKVQEFEDYVQSVDIFLFNKL